MPTPSDLRDSVADLSTLAQADLRSLWSQVSDAVEAREALEDILPALARTYGQAAATIAADWYDDLRLELNVAGRFGAIPAELNDQGADILARWGVDPLFQEEPDWRRAQVLIEGGLQRRIANASRETVRLTSLADPRAEGWQRAGGGDCAFCAMLIGRGAVYSDRTADFASHDNCNCHAVPAFRGRERAVKPYTPSSRRVTDSDRKRVRRYINLHFPDIRG